MVYYMMCTPVVGMAGPSGTEAGTLSSHLMNTQVLAQLMACTQTGEVGTQGGTQVGEADSQVG